MSVSEYYQLDVCHLRDVVTTFGYRVYVVMVYVVMLVRDLIS